MSSLKEQLDSFIKQVEDLKDLKKTIKADIAEWEHTLKGKSALTAEQKKKLSSALHSAKRQLSQSAKPSA